MTDRKWPIAPKTVLSDAERRQYWETTHAEENYETVWSMTEDPDVRNKLTREIQAIDRYEKILVPGCGSKTVLEQQFAERLSDVREICCTDYPGVVEVARRHCQHEKIRYEARDLRHLNFDREWDIVAIVNSVLSESDAENRQILKSCFEALAPGGALVGMFPTIFAPIDIAYLEKTRDRLQYVDLERSSLYETKQKIWQIFYTPLRLRQILKEAGYRLEKMEIFFCDSPYFLEHSRQYYGMDDPDNVIYEFSIVARKPE